ncbi:hypothetical protein GCM10017044_12130 [Kordiimonas sediminis]|uniref:Phage shock protein B n=1 Tax=Kordiimonas sediminis TaxID=1735581 RepID=A0A919APH7_9PROT|nr:hypothetical protein [Kordiimonas sediminis]GHF19150.1 hypothetical protein GCM10017044_12130 [Kordiimonas sediminis]
MHVFEAAAIIVAIVMIAGVINNWIKSKQQQASARTDMDDSTAERIQNLEERVRVLERILTDKSNRLKDEIDAL